MAPVQPFQIAEQVESVNGVLGVFGRTYQVVAQAAILHHRGRILRQVGLCRPHSWGRQKGLSLQYVKIPSNLSPIEVLRLERTQLTQDELAVRRGIPRSTYQRWIAGKTEAKLSLPQMKALCRELGIERVEDMPDHFAER